MIGNQCGVTTDTLYKWIHELGPIVAMKTPNMQPNKRSRVDKVNAFCEFANLPEQKQGEFIRSQGLHWDVLGPIQGNKAYGCNGL
jgi:hypothetical protein